jgi:hypothetical protein
MKGPRWLSRFVTLVVISLGTVPLHAEPPEGFEPYLGLKFHFEIALPKGWSVLDPKLQRSDAERAVPDPATVVAFGALRFTPEYFLSKGDDPVAAKQASLKMDEQMKWVDRGVLPGFLLQRAPAEKGMSCEGFDPSATKSLLEHLGDHSMFHSKAAIREKLHAEPITIGGCRGLRVRGKGTSPDGEAQSMDVFTFSNDKVLFMFLMDNLDEYYAKNVGNFEKAMSTLKLAATPPASAPVSVRGSVADGTLQRDISQLLLKEATALHEGCEPQVLRAEPYRLDEPSAIMASWDASQRKRVERLRKAGSVVLERWFVKSCEAADAYEVLITPSEQGGSDFVVRRLPPRE